MPDEIRVNRPQPSSSPKHDDSHSPMSDVRDRMDGGRPSSMPWVILIIVVVVLIVLGILFRDKLFGSPAKPGSATTATSKSSGYQAVFLTNGQVYFGKMSNADGDYPMLHDIYYLQVVQPPLQGSNQTQAGAQATAAGQAQPQISLVKLGNELHGPVDEMHIAKNQILFYEDMKDDSQVVKAIQSYKTNPTGQPAAQPTPTK